MISPAAWYPSHTTELPQHLPARCSAPYASLFDVSTLLDDRRVHCEEQVVEHLPRLAAVVPQPACNPQPKPSQTAETRSRHLPRVALSATCHVVCHVSRRLPRVASSATCRVVCHIAAGVLCCCWRFQFAVRCGDVRDDVGIGEALHRRKPQRRPS